MFMLILNKLKKFFGTGNNKQKDKKNNSQENIKKIKTKNEESTELNELASRNEESNKLNELALQIDDLCKEIKSAIDQDEISNKIAEEYSKISMQLYDIIKVIYDNRGNNKNSVLKKSIEDNKILEFKPDEYNNEPEFLDILDSIIKNEQWIKKLRKIKGWHSSVWNDKIANAIKKLADFNLTEKFEQN